MRISYLSFLFVFSLLKLGQLVYPTVASDDNLLPAYVKAVKPISFVEQQFALGRSVALSSVDLYDLELIPGVSDTLGSNILERKQLVINASEESLYKKKNKIHPFELVHGVGKKTATKLQKYLRPE